VSASLRDHPVAQEELAMLRTTAIVLVMGLAACTPPPSTTATAAAASNTTSAARASYEAAPVATPVGFNEPPDLRDKICANQYGRGDNYDTVTKASGGFCR
jgi:hypothetical protein